MRGFYQGLQQQNPRAQSAIDPNDSRMHYPDYWKTPIHQTFSNESQWAPANAPSWTDDDKLMQPNGRVVFDDRNQPSIAEQLLAAPKAKGGNVKKPRFSDFRRSPDIEDRRGDNTPVVQQPTGYAAEPWQSEQIAATNDDNPLAKSLGIRDIYAKHADGGRIRKRADGGDTTDTPAYDPSQYDWSKMNQPTGEARNATYTPTQRIGNAVSDALQATGMPHYTANDLTSRVGNLVMASPLGVIGSGMDAAEANSRGDFGGVIQGMAGMIPGVGPEARLAASEASNTLRQSSPKIFLVPSKDPAKSFESSSFTTYRGNDNYDMFSNSGDHVGAISLDAKDPRHVMIDFIHNYEGGGPNSLGAAAMMDVRKAIQNIYPDVQMLFGRRVSGARDQAGKSNRFAQTEFTLPTQAADREHARQLVEFQNLVTKNSKDGAGEVPRWGMDPDLFQKAKDQLALLQRPDGYKFLQKNPGEYGKYLKVQQRTYGGRVHMARGGVPDFDPAEPATPITKGPDFDPAVPATPIAAPSGGITSYLPKAITDVPHEMYQAGAEQVANIKNAWNERHARHEALAADPNASFFDPHGVVNSLKDVADTGRMVLGAASILPSTLIAGPARSLIGHTLADAEHLVGTIINPQQAAKDNPEQMYQTAKGDVDTALSAARPRGFTPRGPLSTPEPIAPEVAANTDLGNEFGINLSRGQATQDLDTIRYEDMAARGAYGKDLQDKAAPFFERQFQDTQRAGQAVGQQTARTGHVVDNPAEAASAVGSEVFERGARARAMQSEAEQQAATEAETQRGMLSDQNRAINEAIRGSSLPVANTTEAGEVVGANVRQAAAQNRAEFQARYNEFGSLPGEFDVSAVRSMGDRIRNELTYGDNPVVIDDHLTPSSSRAIRALDEMSQPRIQNRASPHAEPNPEEITAVSLRGVDQMRKQLVAYYQAARNSGNATDARAMRAVMDGFDGQIERAITENLFSGDPRALQALQEARASYAQYRRNFTPQGAGDDVGTAMRRIVERNATPEETANMIIGSGKLGNAGLPVRIADRLEHVLGADSDSWSALRQAMWQKASQVRNSAGAVDAAKSAQSINDFTGTSLAQRMFTQQERAAMRAHAQGIRDLDRNIEQLPQTQNAARARQAYQDMFGGADLGGAPRAAFQHMVDGTATPEEIANGVFKVIGASNPGHVARALQAIERIVGSDSQTMGAIRQGVWQKLTQNAASKDQPGAQKAMQAINEFLHGSGRTIAEQLYAPNELALMDRYQKALKLTIIPKYARTNSDTAVAWMAAARKYAGMIGSALGFVGLGGAEGGLSGYAVSKLLDKGGEKFIAARQAKKLENSLNNVVPPAGKPITPPKLKSARNAPLIGNVPYRGPQLGPLQGPVPAGADDKKQKPVGP